MNTTCLQCGSILPSGVRVCSFCDSHFPEAATSSTVAAQQDRANPNCATTTDQPADAVWRGQLANRVASYRARRRKTSSHGVGQPELPFDQPAAIAATSSVVTTAEPSAVDPEFSFTIAIGRIGNRPVEDTQMFIDVTLPPAQDPAPGSCAVGAKSSTAHEDSRLYPVAPIEDRRISGVIDGACLLFACGGFLALFGSLGGHFAFSKLSAAVYALSFAFVYLQYFSLFTVFGGTTPGMMLRGLRVVDFSGEDPSPRQYLLRAAGYMLSAGTFFLGFLWSQWDEDELTWHDRISCTYLSSAPSLADSELSGAHSQ